MGKYPKALDYFQQALVIRKQIDDKSGEGTTLTNIASVDRILEAQQVIGIQQAIKLKLF